MKAIYEEQVILTWIRHPSLMKNMFKKYTLNLVKPGFALTQVLLAISLGSAISAGVAYYYKNVNAHMEAEKIVNLIVTEADITTQQNRVGLNVSKGFYVNGFRVDINKRVATISGLAQSQCQALSSNLKSEGDITVSCNDSDGQSNSIALAVDSFKNNSSVPSAITSGASDDFESTTKSIALNGSSNVVLSNTGTKTATNFNYASSDGNTGKILETGSSASIVSGGLTTPVTVSPDEAKSNTGMSCRWRLANDPRFASGSLPSKPMSCGVGQYPSQDQTGTRIFGCTNPTSDSDPTYTDTYTTGVCTSICTPFPNQIDRWTGDEDLGCTCGMLPINV